MLIRNGIPQEKRSQIWKWIILDTVGKEYVCLYVYFNCNNLQGVWYNSIINLAKHVVVTNRQLNARTSIQHASLPYCCDGL